MSHLYFLVFQSQAICNISITQRLCILCVKMMAVPSIPTWETVKTCFHETFPASASELYVNICCWSQSYIMIINKFIIWGVYDYISEELLISCLYLMKKTKLILGLCQGNTFWMCTTVHWLRTLQYTSRLEAVYKHSVNLIWEGFVFSVLGSGLENLIPRFETSWCTPFAVLSPTCSSLGPSKMFWKFQHRVFCFFQSML